MWASGWTRTEGRRRRLAEERRGEERLCTTHDEAHALQAPGAEPQATTGAMKPFKFKLLLSQMSIVLQNNRRIMMNFKLTKDFYLHFKLTRYKPGCGSIGAPGAQGGRDGSWVRVNSSFKFGIMVPVSPFVPMARLRLRVLLMKQNDSSLSRGASIYYRNFKLRIVNLLPSTR